MRDWTDTGGISAWQMLDIPPVWLAGAMALVWAQTWVLPAWCHVFLLGQVLGAVLILSGITLMFWAIAAFRAHQTSVVPHQIPRRLITSGPFARSRNPIYLGDVLVLCGVVLWWGVWPAVVLIPIFVLILQRRFVAPEEARMKENFGTEFSNYMEKTPRWL